MSVVKLWLANTLNRAITLHFGNEGLPGRTFVEMLFQLRTAPKLQRRPDFAFVSYERWPKDHDMPSTAAWHVAPDLVVEVVSPNDSAVEVMEKINQYFQAGIEEVWVLYPRTRNAFIFQSTTKVTALDAAGILEGGRILPGFTLPLADLIPGSA